MEMNLLNSSGIRQNSMLKANRHLLMRFIRENKLVKRKIVHECPKTEDEVNLARIEMGCGSDEYGNNQYMCLPHEGLKYLEAFCYRWEMGIQEEGYCLVVRDNGELQLVSCKSFSSGCPDKYYLIDRFYKYPACLEINLLKRCYLNQPLCPPIYPAFNTTRDFFIRVNPHNVLSISPSKTVIPSQSSAVDKFYNSSSYESLNQWILPSSANSFINTEQKASIESSMHYSFQKLAESSEKMTPSLELNLTSVSIPRNPFSANVISINESISAHMQTANSTMSEIYDTVIKQDNKTNRICDLNYCASTISLDVVYWILFIIAVILFYPCFWRIVTDLSHVHKRIRKHRKKETSEEDFELVDKLRENIEEDKDMVLRIDMENGETDV